MTKQRIGFIGMGLMGVPMSLRLVEAGHTVTVWNRSQAKCDPLAQKNLIVAENIAQLVNQSDVIMLCVTDTEAVRQVVFGEYGVAASIGEDQVLVDFSSIEPAATQQMAADLKHQAGAIWIDAPVSGGVAGAEQGTLAIMAGCDSVTALESVRDALEPLSQRVTHMGPVGTGQMTKICNQMLVSCNVLVMAEVLALAEKAGVDASKIPTALKGGFADSIPLQLTGPRMAERAFEPVKWHVKTLLKDLNMANQVATDLHSAIPMAGLGAELMRLHASQGHADSDPSTLIHQYAEKNV